MKLRLVLYFLNKCNRTWIFFKIVVYIHTPSEMSNKCELVSKYLAYFVH